MQIMDRTKRVRMEASRPRLAPAALDSTTTFSHNTIMNPSFALTAFSWNALQRL